MDKKKIVIVGAGFGGIKAALLLSKTGLFDVTMVSDKNTFRYYPRLYHTATGGDSDETSILLSSIFKGFDIKTIEATVASIDRDKKFIITLDNQKIHYDNLILALGVVTNYFGIDGLEEFSYGIKSMEEAEKLKKHLHQNLIDNKSPDQHYVIIGAGPTGIELSGQLSFYLKYIMKNHGIKNRKINIDLVEAAPRILPTMPEQTSKAVAKRLKSIGIRLMVGKSVQSENIDSLIVSGKPIKSHTVIWTAGVTNNPFFKKNNFKLNERGKVIVDEFIRAEDSIYVIGDNAATQYSGMAQTALDNAVVVAENIIRMEKGLAPKKYKPIKPISVIPAGNYWAAVVWGRVKIHGWLGWSLREAADLIAFHSLEPWWKAGAQWFTEFSDENICPICDKKDKTNLL